MGYFIIAILALGLGYVIGRMPRPEKKKGEIRTFTMVGPNVPPPPPKPKSKTLHVKPGIMYQPGTFVNTHRCNDCGAMGHEYDMFLSHPCPSCGGNVSKYIPAKWQTVDGVNQWVERTKVK